MATVEPFFSQNPLWMLTISALELIVAPLFTVPPVPVVIDVASLLESQTTDADISTFIAVDVHCLNSVYPIQNGRGGVGARDRQSEVFTGIVSQHGTDMVSSVVTFMVAVSLFARAVVSAV
jgi:hypothetical protein